MIEIYPGLWVGGEKDSDAVMAEENWADEWFIVHSAKEPWHRQALGYTGRGAPSDHPEYLVAKRQGEIMLNLVDMKEISAKFTDPIIDAAFEAIDSGLAAGKRVLCHCNEGISRAPMIGLLWLRYSKFSGPFIKRLSFDDALAVYAELYPPLAPGDGMKAFVKAKWEVE